MGSKIPLPINGQPIAPPREDVRRGTVGIITNPNARQSARVPTELLGQSHVLREEVTKSPADLPAALDRLLAHDVEAIVVNGGDGTLGAVIGYLHGKGVALPRLVAVKGGTNNSVAKDVGSVGRIDAVKRKIAEHGSLRDLPTIQRATILVDGPNGRLGCGFFLASGIIARFADAYYAGTMRGPVQAAKVVFEKMTTALLPTRKNREFWAFEPNRVNVDGKVISLPKGAALSYVSTIDTQILFFRPFLATAKELVGQRAFNVLVNALPKVAIVRHFFSLVLGRYNGDGHALAIGKRFELSGTKRVMLDGEMFDVDPKDTLVISPGPLVDFVQI